nr:hypothetical protein [Tanacetum cinerariifolium]
MWDEYAQKRNELGHVVFILQLGKGHRLFIMRYLVQKCLSTGMCLKFLLFDNMLRSCLSITIKKMVATIRECEQKSHCIVYARIHKIHKESGWAYTACKVCNKKVDVVESKAASGSGKSKVTFYCEDNGAVHVKSIFKHGMDVDEYWPQELDELVGKRFLFKLYYLEYNVNNNNHTYHCDAFNDDPDMVKHFKAGFMDDEDVDEGFTTPANRIKSVTLNESSITRVLDLKSPSSKVSDSGQSLGRDKKRVWIDLDDIESKEEDESGSSKTLKLISVKSTSSSGKSKVTFYCEDNGYVQVASRFGAHHLNQIQFKYSKAVPAVDPVSYSYREQNSPVFQSNKRPREVEAKLMQKKLQISLNQNYYNEESARPSSILNQLDVSTGLKLSYDDEERNSSITSASGTLHTFTKTCFMIDVIAYIWYCNLWTTPVNWMALCLNSHTLPCEPHVQKMGALMLIRLPAERSELDERMGDLWSLLESFGNDDSIKSHKVNVVQALKWIETWNLFSATSYEIASSTHVNNISRSVNAFPISMEEVIPRKNASSKRTRTPTQVSSPSKQAANVVGSVFAISNLTPRPKGKPRISDNITRTPPFQGIMLVGSLKIKSTTVNDTCKGKVRLSNEVREPPPLLKDLITKKHPKSASFKDNIRRYNSMFLFTSMGGKQDTSVNVGRGPYCYRLHGENYHLAGSLLPQDGKPLKFAQLYIFDTDNEIENRIKAASNGASYSSRNNELDYQLTKEIRDLLDSINPLVKDFRMAELEECLRKKNSENEHLKPKVVDCTMYQNLQEQVEELKSVIKSFNLSIEELYKARALAEATLRERDEKISVLLKKLRLLEEQFKVFHE